MRTSPRPSRPIPLSARPRSWALLLVCLLCWSTSSIAREPPVAIRGWIVKVRDGDTVQMLTDAGKRIEVRLNAIDAPEKTHGGMRGQAYAERSRLSLAQLAARRRATLLHATMDRYGRHVGMLSVDTAHGGIDAGWWQLNSGYAWVYERYLDEIPMRLRLRYREAQSQARADRRGLWADPRPVPPWTWRRRQAAP
jgi:endonuclease YncB( thermonuclease family)